MQDFSSPARCMLACTCQHEDLSLSRDQSCKRGFRRAIWLACTDPRVDWPCQSFARQGAGAELFAGHGTDWIPDTPGAQITLDKQLYEAEEFL